jgi:hypothetical protein
MHAADGRESRPREADRKKASCVLGREYRFPAQCC